MARVRRDSLVVNNFFTLASIIIISVTMVLYNKYIVKDEKKTTRVNSNLECQLIAKTIDKITSPQLIKEVNYYLENGNYILNGGFIKPRFGKFYLEDKIDLEQANQMFIDSIKFKPKENPIKYLSINYEIIENDKNDPRKKEGYEKSYAGRLLTSFRINGKELFMMNSDFLDYSGESIKDRIECTIKALKENAK